MVVRWDANLTNCRKVAARTRPPGEPSPPGHRRGLKQSTGKPAPPQPRQSMLTLVSWAGCWVRLDNWEADLQDFPRPVGAGSWGSEG